MDTRRAIVVLMSFDIDFDFNNSFTTLSAYEHEFHWMAGSVTILQCPVT